MPVRQVEVGTPFTVEAEAASGTGYAWTVAGTTPGLTAIGDPETLDAAPMPGAPVRVAFAFRADAPGEHEVVLELRRPWEADAAEQRRVGVVAV